MSPSHARTFRQFYVETFLPEHRHPICIAFHLGGTLASTALACATLWWSAPLWLLAWPLVHVVPGLVGHRLVERNAAVGDLRVTRKDFPLRWFLWGNHLMAAHLVASWVGLARRPWSRSPSPLDDARAGP